MFWISVGVNIAFAIGAIIMGIIVSVRKMLRKRRTVVVHFGNGRPVSKISQSEAEKLGFTGPEPPLYPESAYPPREDWPKPNQLGSPYSRRDLYDQIARDFDKGYQGPGTRAWADQQEKRHPELPEN